MNTALITTTVNVPKVLALYRKLGPGVHFFVTGDEKTPPVDTWDFDWAAIDLSKWHYFSAEQQKYLGWKCSELIGWNCVQRRNIALLEAVKAGADILVMRHPLAVEKVRNHIDNLFAKG